MKLEALYRIPACRLYHCSKTAKIGINYKLQHETHALGDTFKACDLLIQICYRNYFVVSDCNYNSLSFLPRDAAMLARSWES